ncbi:MAG: PaaI family thioesterase [Alphaproteobacteria bacterium]|nr:MAG: PaaI family thioesterase [Alphaproteobacteria bacterium]
MLAHVHHGPFATLVGYELTAWHTDEATVALSVTDRHINRSGVVHGGVIATLIDTACGFAGCYRPPPQEGRRAMTLALTTQFIAPAVAGMRITAHARRTGGGRQIFFASCEVRDQDGRLIASGEGTFRYRREA